MNEFRQIEREAKESIPEGFARLPKGENLRADDLVWSIYTKEFLRADSPEWKFPALETPIEEIVFAVRKIGISEFERQIERRKVFTVKR